MLNLTYNEMLSAYSKYPAPIRPYLLRAETHPLLRETLTKSFMRAFIDLLSRANIANPARPIQVRMDLTARRLGLSAKTVSRTIGLMLENAWLTVNESHDGRNWEGKYAGREFIICDSLRKLVGLPYGPGVQAVDDDDSDDPKGAGSSSNCPGDLSYATNRCPSTQCEPQAKPNITAVEPGGCTKPAHIASAVDNGGDKPNPDRTGLSDGDTSYPQIRAKSDPNQTELSDGHIGVNKVFLKKEASLHKGAFIIENDNGKPIRVPADLAELHTVLGITGRGICTLMRLAKERSQRLQDVWKVKQEQILKAGATGGRAMQYLRALLNSGEDFSYVARCKITNPIQDMNAGPSSSGKASPSAGTGAAVQAPVTAGDMRSDEDINLGKLGQLCAFKKFRHISNGMVVRFFDGTAEVSRGKEWHVFAGWEMMRNLYLGVARGNLVEVAQ